MRFDTARLVTLGADCGELAVAQHLPLGCNQRESDDHENNSETGGGVVLGRVTMPEDSINFIGDILLMEEAKKAKEILDGWKKGKKLPKEVMTGILNTVLNKCNIQALIMSEQINLPPPIPLPKLQPAQEKD